MVLAPATAARRGAVRFEISTRGPHEFLGSRIVGRSTPGTQGEHCHDEKCDRKQENCPFHSGLSGWELRFEGYEVNKINPFQQFRRDIVKTLTERTNSAAARLFGAVAARLFRYALPARPSGLQLFLPPVPLRRAIIARTDLCVRNCVSGPVRPNKLDPLFVATRAKDQRLRVKNSPCRRIIGPPNKE